MTSLPFVNSVIIFLRFSNTLSILIITSDGSIAFTNWGIMGGDFEPIEDDSLKCASMCYGDECNGDNYWYSNDCTEEKQYVCEYKCKNYLQCIKPYAKKIIIVYTVQCGEGWMAFDNSCYKHETQLNMRLTCTDGRDYCEQTYGAELFVPNSLEEAQFIADYLTGVKVRDD